MKRWLLLAFILSAVGVSAQYQVEVPDEVAFTDMRLRLSPEYKQKIKKEADFLTANNRYFRASVERADAFFPIIERILAEEQVPDDFKYLVLQESKLTSDVVSGSNAVGYWQFKAATAQEVGLSINEAIDERMNIVASTRAAAKYVKKHNVHVNNWLYSLLAYYAGLTGARSITPTEWVGAKELVLDTNTHWYITKYIAHKVAYEGNIHLTPNLPVRVIEYGDCENKSLEEIALATGIPYEDLSTYNKWVRQGRVPGDKDYTVILPIKANAPLSPSLDLGTPIVAAVTAAQPVPQNLEPYKKTVLFGLITVDDATSVPVQEARAIAFGNKSTGYNYKSSQPLIFSWNGIKAIMARKEDNINSLALAAELDRDDFLQYNDLRVFDKVVAGQVYYIKSKRKKAKVPYHIVREGETLWEVAQNYGIELRQLLKKNRMDRPEKLQAGRKLYLRQQRPDDVPVEIMPVPEPRKATPTEVAASQPVVQSNTTSPGMAFQTAKPHKAGQIDVPKEALRTDLPDSVRVAALLASVKAGKSSVQASKDSSQVKAHLEHSLKEISKDEKKPLIQDPEDDDDDFEPNNETPVKYRAGFQWVRISSGQTLFGLSRILKVDFDSLKAWNKLSQGQSFTLGMPVYYKTQSLTGEEPLNKKPQIKNPIDSLQAKIPSPNYHLVKPGDTFFSIARKYGMSIQELQAMNGKAQAKIFEGEKLKVKALP